MSFNLLLQQGVFCSLQVHLTQVLQVFQSDFCKSSALNVKKSYIFLESDIDSADYNLLCDNRIMSFKIEPVLLFISGYKMFVAL